MRFFVFAACTILASAVTLKTSKPPAADSKYDDFLHRHGHRQTGQIDHVAYETRRDLYHNRVAEISAHNVQRRSWVAGVNKFADYTNEELHGMLGYKRWARSSRGSSPWSSLIQLQAGGEMIRHQEKHHAKPTAVTSPREKAAVEVDWSRNLSSAKFLRDQGSCGSCWAVAAAGALEMQLELRTGKATQLSYQQLVDCTPNPHHCGGTGGCEGATAELAFEYVKHAGLASDDQYGAGSSMFSGGCQKPSSTAAAVTGWHQLPTNKGEPLKLALTQQPVVISVDGTKWFGYESGIFDGCDKDTVINHAVLAIGYGKDDSIGSQQYWRIRNSWGQQWGEDGHIRLLRHTNDKDYCGIDNDPKQGVGCDGGPSQIPICGMCGVLSDSSHPVGTTVHM